MIKIDGHVLGYYPETGNWVNHDDPGARLITNLESHGINGINGTNHEYHPAADPMWIHDIEQMTGEELS